MAGTVRSPFLKALRIFSVTDTGQGLGTDRERKATSFGCTAVRRHKKRTFGMAMTNNQLTETECIELQIVDEIRAIR